MLLILLLSHLQDYRTTSNVIQTDSVAVSVALIALRFPSKSLQGT